MNDVRRGLFERLLGRFQLRFPALFAIFAALTLIDLVIPDVVPFVDELGLALLTMIFGMWRDRRSASNHARPE